MSLTTNKQGNSCNTLLQHIFVRALQAVLGGIGLKALSPSHCKYDAGGLLDTGLAMSLQEHHLGNRDVAKTSAGEMWPNLNIRQRGKKSLSMNKSLALLPGENAYEFSKKLSQPKVHPKTQVKSKAYPTFWVSLT